MKKTNEKLIDNLVPDGGLCPIFRTIGCIGDSLSSGEHVSMMDGKIGFHDYYEYSWGQYIARTTGATVYNFSAGGMSAESFQWNKERLGFLDPDKKCQAYIIALGVNDAIAKVPTGSISDIHPESPELNNTNTFAGRLGKIISEVKTIQPKSRIFLVTNPKYTSADNRHLIFEEQRNLCFDISKLFEFTYIIDLWSDTPDDDHLYWTHCWMNGHLNTIGYLITARWIMTHIDYIIRQKPEDFGQVAFIGRENNLHNENFKW